MRSSKATRVPLLCMPSELAVFLMVAAMVFAVSLLLTGCNVTLANRSNVINQTSVGPGGNEQAGDQDSMPVGGGALTIPISPAAVDDKGPQS